MPPQIQPAARVPATQGQAHCRLMDVTHFSKLWLKLHVAVSNSRNPGQTHKAARHPKNMRQPENRDLNYQYNISWVIMIGDKLQ